jgi:ATP-dependent 26S proteasome regulatory subunit
VPEGSRASDIGAAVPFSGAIWDAVGGNVAAMQQLREMVLLPLLYPEVFAQMGICVPR